MKTKLLLVLILIPLAVFAQTQTQTQHHEQTPQEIFKLQEMGGIRLHALWTRRKYRIFCWTRVCLCNRLSIPRFGTWNRRTNKESN